MNKSKTPLFLYNTQSREKEKITPLDGHTIKMYTCGPTVYNFAHIGNFRTYVFEDLLRRSIKFFGIAISQAMNITDIDDKTIKGALEKNVPLAEFTKPYIDAFFEDLKTLNIEPVEFYPRATAYIPDMITIIEKLLQDEVAYLGPDGSIYFSIKKFPSYGKLSHLKLGELKAGAGGVIVDEYEKENVSDFVLWKVFEPSRDGNIFWESPFGKGRPGWHLECSAMAMKLLGPSIDIHAGGVDNIFPHHENEIAQSECYSCKQFVRHWVHAEHLLVDHKKMSKSLGNFYTLRDLLEKGFSGPSIRYMLLQTHYRTQLNFTLQGLQAAVNSLERFSAFILRLKEIQEERDEDQRAVQELLEKTNSLFCTSLADDLNISVALSALFDLVREANTLCDRNLIGKEGGAKILSFLAEVDKVLGCLPLDEKMETIPIELEEALQKRDQARAEKNWKLADEARDFILSKGYTIEDTPKGSRLKKLL